MDQQQQRGELPLPDEVAIPDYVEARVGWRVWSLQREDPPVLRSVSHNVHCWEPRKEMRGWCVGDHQVPGEDCSCGLYSARSLAELQAMHYHRYDAATGPYHLIGSVWVWGKVVEYNKGWRAQYGYPRELFLPFEAWMLAEPLEELYGIPVRLKNTLSTKREVI